MAGQYQQPDSRGAAPRSAFSRESVNRAVLKTVLQKPYVLYPAAAGLLGGLAAILLGPDLLSLGALIGGSLTALAAWGVDFTLRRERHAAAYLDSLHVDLAERRKRFVENLERELDQLNLTDGLGQLWRLQEKYAAFESLLKRKLDPSELTYSRYVGMAEQVYLSALDNLHRVIDLQQGVAAIDEVFLQQRVLELEALPVPSQEQRDELDALLPRLQLKRRQAERINQWLARNEQAMTQLDLTMAAIADMNTVRGQAGIDMESAMEELQRLASRSREYDRDS